MVYHIILAAAPNCVIGCDNRLPWHLPADLQLFRQHTRGQAVLMGHNTWRSVGRLKGRTNIVLTHDARTVEGAPDQIITDLAQLSPSEQEIWVIGGAQVYREVLGGEYPIGHVFVSRMEKPFAGDAYFFNTFPLHLQSMKQMDGFQWLSYACAPSAPQNERQYLRLLQRVLLEGCVQHDRTQVGTLALFGEQLKFDLQEGFPLLTTKRMAWKAIQEELFFFLAGKTNTKELEEKGIGIWRAHTSSAFLAERKLPYTEGEMGPMYGAQWRNFGGRGIDQLTKVIQELRTDPFSRRMLMTTFNPEQADQGVLYPCHGIVVQWFVRRDADGTSWLSALMYQRSADVFLGLPFNIASYALMVHLVADCVHMKPDKLILSLGNVHLYANHVEQARTQLARMPLVAPQVEIVESVRDWNAVSAANVRLWGYFYYPAISAPLAV